MALWDDLKTDVITWTNRPKLIAETELALRQAIRTAHRQGKFWKDTTKVPYTPTDDQIQAIDIATWMPNFKQMAYVKAGEADFYYSPIDNFDLLDHDGIARENIYWGIGGTLNIRSDRGDSSLELCYYRQPTTTPPESIEDWLLRDYRDVVVLLAASTVLGAVGEQDVKGTVDKLLVIAVKDLVADNLEIQGR